MARVLKVPERASLAQPNADLPFPQSSRRHQVNGHDRVSGTHRVPDASSATIMSAFYDGILAGGRPVDALRDAMLAARGRPGGNRFDR